VNIDDPDHPGDKLLQLLQDNQIDLNVVEGCGSSLPSGKSRIRPTDASSSNSPKDLENNLGNSRRPVSMKSTFQ